MARKAYNWLTKGLRALYAHIVNQRIPDTMAELLERLDAEERKRDNDAGRTRQD